MNPLDIQNKFLRDRKPLSLYYIEKSKAIREDMKQAKSIDLSGDGRCYSTGYNTKYLTFSFFHFPQRKLPRLEILTEWKRWDLKRL